MRCPKCSFISYDQIETCVKCGKNISAAAKLLHGTTVKVPAPGFLKIEVGEPEPHYEADAAGEGTADVAAGEAEDLVDFSVEEGVPPEIDIGTDEVELDIDEEEPVEEEEPFVDLGAEEPEVTEPEEEAIDISDLAPSEEVEAEVEAEVEPEVEAVEEDYVEEPVAEEEGHEGQALKDLKVDIDLEDADDSKGKVMPSVKTGTALDDFDIDLGDLLTSKKE